MEQVMFLSDLVGNWYPVYNFYHLAPMEFKDEYQAIKWARENLALGRAFKLVDSVARDENEWTWAIEGAEIRTVTLDLERMC